MFFHCTSILLLSSLPAATKLGQGNKFTGVCLSTRGGGLVQILGGGCLTQILGGVSDPNFSGGEGVSAPNFRGGGSAPNFQGGVCSKFLGGGGVCSKFSGGGLLQILGGVSEFFFSFFFSIYFAPPKKFFWDAHPPPPPRDGQCAAGTHPTGMHSCWLFFFHTKRNQK